MDTIFGCVVCLVALLLLLGFLIKGICEHEETRARESEKAWQAQEAIWKKTN